MSDIAKNLNPRDGLRTITTEVGTGIAIPIKVRKEVVTFGSNLEEALARADEILLTEQDNVASVMVRLPHLGPRVFLVTFGGTPKEATEASMKALANMAKMKR